ncbi:tautomerase family protein [Carnobacterium gallinarum]|uniref:tautomerase family protein n=1 Tax=Carnobacterium gallinarum TaxID=2749 RepID=UPI000551DB0A|nr:tautomerase family protein [Carnobacterium gallinarum]
MPLLKLDLIEGPTESEIKAILDVAYAVTLDVFNVPAGDRYQIVTQHKPYEMILEDTGLGFQRDPKKMLSFTVITRKRNQTQKEQFYQQLAQQLEEVCHIESKNLFVSMIVTEDEDWSFGYGKAQFLTGDL